MPTLASELTGGNPTGPALDRAALEAMPQGVWVADANRKLLYANRAWREYLGLPNDDGDVAVIAASFLHPDDADAVNAGWARAMDARGSVNVTCRIRDHAGHYRWFTVRAEPLLDAGGLVTAWVGTNTDVDDAVRDQERRAFLAEAGASFAGTLDVESTLKRIVRLVVPRLADWCAVYLPTGDGRLEPLAVAHTDPERVSTLRRFLTLYPIRTDDASTTTGGVFVTGRSHFVPEVTDAVLEAAAPDATWLDLVRRLRLRSVMTVPMTARGRTVGAIGLGLSDDGRRFTPDDLAFAEELARRAATAVDNARLYSDARLAADRTARLQAVTAALSEALTSDAVARVILEQAVPSVDANAGVVVRGSNPEEFELVGAIGYPEGFTEPHGRPAAHAGDPLADAVTNGAAVFLEDLGDTRATGAAWRAASTRAVAALPLAVHGRVTGGLSLSFREPRRFTASERDFLGALALQCAQALERARLIEALERERALFRAVLQQMPSGVVIAEAPSGRILLGNSRVARIWRRDAVAAEALPQYTKFEAYHADGRPYEAHEWPLARALRLGEITDGEEINIVRVDGTRGVMLGSAAPIYAPDGRITAAVAVSHDITEHKAAEAALRDLNATLERRVADRTAALEDAAAAVEARNAALEAQTAELEGFVYTVSHDLRAPLLSIQGLTAALEDASAAGDDAEAAYVRQRIAANAAKMEALLGDVLSLSRAGRQLEEPEPLDLAAVLDTALADLEPLIRRCEARVDVVPAAAWPRVLYGRSDAYQVLVNLVSNALKYGGRHGEAPQVRVEAVPAGAWLTLRVSDDGPGVAPRYRERVFDLFQRLHAGGEGSGVGLAIVRRTVERYGGRAWVDDSSLGGAAFHVTLPVAAPDAER